MSTGRSKVESRTNAHGCNTVFLWLRRRLPCLGVSAAADTAAARSKSEFPRSTVASDTGQDRPTGHCQTAVSYHSRLSRWSKATIRRRYDQTLRYRVNDAPLSQSCSPARQAKHLCYVIHVCAIETRFRLRRLQPPTLHVCACLSASPAPSSSTAPVHGLLETAARGKQRVVVCRLVSRSSHAAAISKQRMYWRVSSQKLD